MRRLSSLACVAVPFVGACVTIEPLPPDPYQSGAPGDEATDPGLEVDREARAVVGDEIVVCGQRFATGAPVVLWNDPGGYNGYETRLVPGTNPSLRDKSTDRRYRAGRRVQVERGTQSIEGDSESVEALALAVDQFVLHFDACGLSSTCFDVLHHQRGLSVHFLLDIDGTIYQTLDARETAWHATKANDRSIGIEIAQIGAREPNNVSALQEWYSSDEAGPYIRIPERFGDGDVRTQPFRGRPARSSLQSGRINGTGLVQYDFTPEQYESLGRLLATLTEVLPRIDVRVPRDTLGRVPNGQLTDAEFESFSGILGHYHVQDNKVDPGPAFDWERLLGELRLRQLEAGLP